MKKTWIKVKRGILEPKHREQMGSAVWLYLYMLDIVSWDTGCIINWKDAVAAQELDLNIETVRRSRRKLEEIGYIRCNLRRTSQVISITNWTNPREYSGELYNEGVKGSTTQGTTNVNTQGSRDINTPTYNSHLKESHKKNQSRKRDERLDQPAIQAYRSEARLHVPIALRDDVIQAVGDIEEDVLAWKALVHEWIGYGYNPRNVKGMLDAYKNGGIKRGAPPPTTTSATDELRRKYGNQD